MNIDADQDFYLKMNLKELWLQATQGLELLCLEGILKK